jgi:hypothetical protein
MKKNKSLKFEEIPPKDWTWGIVSNEMNNKTNEKEKIYFLKKVRAECEVTRINIRPKSKSILEKLSDIEKSADVYIKYNEEILKDKLKNLAKKHFHGDFIIWLVGLEKLKLFVKLLIKSKLIIEIELSEALNLIEEHFECADVVNSDPKKSKKIKWGKSIPLLAYLINKLLDEKNKFIHECKHPYALFALHFIDVEGNPISNTDLNDATSKTKSSTTKRPRNAEIVDDIISEVKRLK